MTEQYLWNNFCTHLLCSLVYKDAFLSKFNQALILCILYTLNMIKQCIELFVKLWFYHSFFTLFF